MKKFFILVLTICILTNLTAYANEISDTSIFEEKNLEDIYNVEEKTFGYIRDVGNGFWVGIPDENGINRAYFTKDFKGFTKISMFYDEDLIDNGSTVAFMDSFIWTGDSYMARTTAYDNIGKNDRITTTKGYVYILNQDFHLIKKICFDNYVIGMSYVDGIYYVKTTDITISGADKVYSSYDLNNWTEREDITNIPIINKRTSVNYFDNHVETFNNDSRKNMIIYESVKLTPSKKRMLGISAKNVLNAVGDYFIIPDNINEYDSSIWISKDAVYFTEFHMPSGQHADVIKNQPGGILISTSTEKKYYISNENIDRYLCDGNVYVQFQDKILGFTNPPVIEEGSTLVPMRFLFEQMGADVDWNGATRTATATLDDTAVTFSIDNTQATVNKSPAKMAVPARLIDDKTMVPLRFLSEELGFTVTWDADTRTAIIE